MLNSRVGPPGGIDPILPRPGRSVGSNPTQWNSYVEFLDDSQRPWPKATNRMSTLSRVGIRAQPAGEALYRPAGCSCRRLVMAMIFPPVRGGCFPTGLELAVGSLTNVRPLRITAMDAAVGRKRVVGRFALHLS